MKSKVIEVLKKDAIIEEIIDIFKEEFTEEYNKLNSEQREKILLLRDSIFRNWFYGALIDETYLTPNFLINKIAQNAIEGDYNIVSHIKPVKFALKSDDNIDYEVKYIYYSLKEHPVIEDLKLLLEFSGAAITIKEDNQYLIENGEEIIDLLNFRSSYYIEYLIDVAEELGLVKEMRAIGCKCLNIVNNRYLEFNSYSNEEKLMKIVEASIKVSFKGINRSNVFRKKLNKKDIVNLLDNDIYYDAYYEFDITNIQKKVLNDLDIANEMRNMELEENDSKMFEIVDKLFEDKEDLLSAMIQMHIGTVMDVNFVSIFAYYLGIISPAISSIYLMSGHIQGLKNATDSEQSLSLIFKSDDLHDLTPLGEIIMKSYKNKFNDRLYKDIDSEVIEDQLYFSKKEKAKFKKESFDLGMDNLLDDLSNDEENYDEYDDFLDYDDEDYDEDDYEDCIIWEFVRPHIEEFEEYIIEDLGLKESTASKHCSNVEIFLQMYLRSKDINKVKKLKHTTIDRYIREEYTHMATSKTDLTNQLGSFSKYATFLGKKGYITEEEMEKIKKLNKRKEEYIKLYEEICKRHDSLF